MNTRDAMDRLLHAKRSNIRSCGIKPPDKCHACDADREAIEQLEADAQTLADVRTLDEWAEAHPDDSLAPRFRGEPFAPPEQQWEGFVAGEWEFFPSADAARAATAAWVREQAK